MVGLFDDHKPEKKSFWAVIFKKLYPVFIVIGVAFGASIFFYLMSISTYTFPVNSITGLQEYQEEQKLHLKLTNQRMKQIEDKLLTLENSIILKLNFIRQMNECSERIQEGGDCADLEE